MNIVVLVKLVPDLVEELAIDASGKALDASWLRLIISEFDDHALEQAILLKEAGGGQVTVIAPDSEGVDDMLFAASARGADRLIKLTGEAPGVNNHAMARALAEVVKPLGPDLIMTGLQAHTDVDGSVGPLLAGLLDLPYIGYVAGVAAGANKVTVRKEYPGGLVAEMEVSTPSVLGIQAAEKPPRYVPISKVRQAMKTATIDTQEATAADPRGGPTVDRMFPAAAGERATMIEGDADQVATRLVSIFKEAGVL